MIGVGLGGKGDQCGGGGKGSEGGSGGEGGSSKKHPQYSKDQYRNWIPHS